MQKSAAIDYQHDGYACEGFAVWDEAGDKRPGILVFPEWGGVGEYTEKRADMLGELGFNAFVVDVYGKGIRPEHPGNLPSRDDEICHQPPAAAAARALRPGCNCARCRTRIWAGSPPSATASAA